MSNTNTTTRKPTKRDHFNALLKLSEVKADGAGQAGGARGG